MTTKLSWNQFNKVPYDTMRWRGIDGTEVLAHFITTVGIGQDVSNFFTTYNGLLHPDAIMGGWERYQNKNINNDIQSPMAMVTVVEAQPGKCWRPQCGWKRV